MLSHPSLSNIQPDHLDRDALIYIRQSSLIQVRDNTSSTMQQYDLVQRALSLGWTRERIHVIDQDQGHSGSSSIGRDVFHALVAEVRRKHCGAVLSLETGTRIVVRSWTIKNKYLDIAWKHAEQLEKKVKDLRTLSLSHDRTLKQKQLIGQSS